MNKLNTINNVQIINFNRIDTDTAFIDVFPEVNSFFCIKRVFTVSVNKVNVKRGFHAHKNCEQIISCPIGKINFIVFDGENEKTFTIENNNIAIYVPNFIWTETVYLEKKSVLVCYCSEQYDEKSYIRDKKEYLKIKTT